MRRPHTVANKIAELISDIVKKVQINYTAFLLRNALKTHFVKYTNCSRTVITRTAREIAKILLSFITRIIVSPKTRILILIAARIIQLNCATLPAFFCYKILMFLLLRWCIKLQIFSMRRAHGGAGVPHRHLD